MPVQFLPSINRLAGASGTLRIPSCTKSGHALASVPESGALWGTLAPMIDRQAVDEFKRRVSEALRASPARDLEKNLHALLGAFFERFDLAAREDLDVQKKLLERAQARLAALETRIAELESRKP